MLGVGEVAVPKLHFRYRPIRKGLTVCDYVRKHTPRRALRLEFGKGDYRAISPRFPLVYLPLVIHRSPVKSTG